MLTGDGIGVGMALSQLLYHLKDKVLQQQKPACCLYPEILSSHHRVGMVGYESEAPTLQIRAELHVIAMVSRSIAA